MKMILPPFGKGGSRGIFQMDMLRNPPWPPFFKGGNPFDFSILDSSMKFNNDTCFRSLEKPGKI